MTYNVRSLRDDAHAVVRVVRGADPDVLCIQEAPRFLFWRRKCARLAKRTGLRIAAGGRPAAANLVLVRPDVRIEAARSVLFTKDPGLHQRGVAMALLRVADRRVVVAGTHLDGYPEPRLRHVGELFAALDSFTPADVPTAFAGDFNDDPGTPVWSELGTRGADAFAIAGEGEGEGAGCTLNVTDPTRRIDAVFAGPGLAVRAAAAIDSADVRIASDHRPVLADVGFA